MPGIGSRCSRGACSCILAFFGKKRAAASRSRAASANPREEGEGGWGSGPGLGTRIGCFVGFGGGWLLREGRDLYLAGKPTPAAPAQAPIRNLPKSLPSSPEEKVLRQKAGEVEGRPTKPKTDGSGGGDPLSRERFPTPPGSFLLPRREEVGRASESLGAKDPSLLLHPPPPAPPTPSQTEAFTFSYCFIAES